MIGGWGVVSAESIYWRVFTPKWTNRLPRWLALAASIGWMLVSVLVWKPHCAQKNFSLSAEMKNSSCWQSGQHSMVSSTVGLFIFWFSAAKRVFMLLRVEVNTWLGCLILFVFSINTFWWFVGQLCHLCSEVEMQFIEIACIACHRSYSYRAWSDAVMPSSITYNSLMTNSLQAE